MNLKRATFTRQPDGSYTAVLSKTEAGFVRRGWHPVCYLAKTGELRLIGYSVHVARDQAKNGLAQIGPCRLYHASGDQGERRRPSTRYFDRVLCTYNRALKEQAGQFTAA